MRIISSMMLLPGVVLTVLYIKAGSTATAAGDDVVFAWLNAWMAGPILLLFAVPMLFSNAPIGVDRKFRGRSHRPATVESVRRTGLTVDDGIRLYDNPGGAPIRLHGPAKATRHRPSTCEPTPPQRRSSGRVGSPRRRPTPGRLAVSRETASNAPRGLDRAHHWP